MYAAKRSNEKRILSWLISDENVRNAVFKNYETKIYILSRSLKRSLFIAPSLLKIRGKRLVSVFKLYLGRGRGHPSFFFYSVLQARHIN